MGAVAAVVVFTRLQKNKLPPSSGTPQKGDPDAIEIRLGLPRLNPDEKNTTLPRQAKYEANSDLKLMLPSEPYLGRMAELVQKKQETFRKQWDRDRQLFRALWSRTYPEIETRQQLLEAVALQVQTTTSATVPTRV